MKRLVHRRSFLNNIFFCFLVCATIVISGTYVKYHSRFSSSLTAPDSSVEKPEYDAMQSDAFRCDLVDGESARNRALTRAIVVYFSAAQLRTYLDQIRWCMRSLLEVMKTEPPLWRTDMVVYVEDVTLPELLDLGCSTKPRLDASEPFRCVLVKYTRIRDRKTGPNSTEYERNLQQQLKEYPYGESLIPLAENPSAYSGYDYVVRTDLDVFFTPAFSTWTPPNCAFVTGSGGYSHEYNMHKLAHIANYSGIYFNSSVWNIGSTWIAPAHLIAKVAARAVHWMIHLSRIEFSPKMRTSAWWGQASMWPEWHYGVLSMYGAHLAINEVTKVGKRFPFRKMDIDHPTSSKLNCSLEGPLHLHTYQSAAYFSKYVFNDRKYDGNNSLPAVLNSTRCCDYAAYIAADSLRYSLTELASKMLSAKIMP